MKQDLYLGLERCPEEIGVKLAGWLERIRGLVWQGDGECLPVEAQPLDGVGAMDVGNARA
jgi:hypothetical protein